MASKSAITCDKSMGCEVGVAATAAVRTSTAAFRSVTSEASVMSSFLSEVMVKLNIGYSTLLALIVQGIVFDTLELVLPTIRLDGSKFHRIDAGVRVL